MTVASHLSDLKSKLVLSSIEDQSITTSIDTLVSRLDSWFGGSITSRFQFGSNPRGTILPRKADSHSDVDVMVVFETAKAGQKEPQTYLERLKKFTEEKYSTSERYQSSPTIVLNLNHIRFELVPAIYNYGFYIPSPASSYSKWMATDPNTALSVIQDKNKAENYNIKPLVRLIKYWNATKSWPLSSFGIETDAVGKYYFGCTTLSDYFFSFWRNYTCPWDASQTTKQKVATAKQYASNAESYLARSMPASAEDEVKKIVPAL